MSSVDPERENPARPPGVFATTHWSVVSAAGQDQGERAQTALAKLCETYRAPVLAYSRGLGFSPEDAEDLTQSFFALFIRTNVPSRVEHREGVKFRSFLLRCFKNFLANERERNQARKRGGGRGT